MRVRPMLGEYALEGIEGIESGERRTLVEHRVPGMEGSYLQDLGSAPNAILIPISFLRCVTIYDITPYRPIIASNAARTPKKPDSVAITRSVNIESLTCWLN